MSERKSFLLRVDRELLDAVQRWAGDDLRSLNGQIEFLLRRALQQAGRLSAAPPKGARTAESSQSPPVRGEGQSLDVDATGEP